MNHLNTSQNDNQAQFDCMVVGEALIDVVTRGDSVVEHAGGSPANVAYGLGRLGVSTALLTAIGPDARGNAIERHLQEAGVTMLPGSRSLAKTASASAFITADGSANYVFDIAWELVPSVPAYVPKVLHTGSIATFLSPGAGVVKSLLEQASDRALITYDPNIRPALLGSHAEAKSLFEELVPLTDVVKLSDEDAHWLYPQKSLADTAAHVLGLGTGLTVITNGADGSQFTTRATTINIPAVKCTVADTIGAGDSYMSALILGILNLGMDGYTPAVLEKLGHTAAAAAAITVQRPGANPPTLLELNDVIDQA